MAANVVWGVALVAILVLANFSSPLVAILAAVGLALPTAGIYRLAAIIARDEPASLSDAFAAWRRYGASALLTGLVVTGLLFVLSFNLVLGLISGNPVLLLIGTLAGWGLLALFIATSAFWPLLLDPVREGESLRQKMKLALTVIFVAPGRYLGLTLITGAILIVSTVAFAALLSISVAFVALTMCRYVLPTADRLEGRATFAEPILD